MKHFRILFFLVAALLVWLGCNSILGISDPTFVPIPDSSVENLETGPPGVTPDVQLGPVRPSRRVVRIPRGERSSFIVTVDPQGKPGNVVLTAKSLVTQDVSVFQAPDSTTPNRFKITLTAKAEAGNVDERLLMQAVTDQKAVIGSAEVRIVVGAPGTVDTSFGNDAGTSTTIGAPQQVTFGVVGASVLFVAEDNSVWDLSEDGVNVRQLFALDTKGKPECGIAAMSADPGTVLVAGYCPQSMEDFLALGSRDADGGPSAVAPIEIVPQQDLFKITRVNDAGFYLALSPDGGTEVHAYPANDLLPATARYVPITVAASLIPGDGGVMVVGREEDPLHISEVARLAGTPLVLATSFGDGGLAGTEHAEPATTEIPVGAASTSGTVMIATPVANKVLVQGYSTKGVPTVATTIDGFSQAVITADRRDRFVVGVIGADNKMSLRRFKSDGTADAAWTSGLSLACPRGQLGVDDDGMIVVFCAGSPASTAYRVWP